MKLIHYKLKNNLHQPIAEFNHVADGDEPLTEYGIGIVKRIISEKHDVDYDNIIICNIMIIKDNRT